MQMERNCELPLICIGYFDAFLFVVFLMALPLILFCFDDTLMLVFLRHCYMKHILEPRWAFALIYIFLLLWRTCILYVRFFV